MFTYAGLDNVRALLTLCNATPEGREKFENSIHHWGVGGCYLILTPEQYKRLKSRTTS